MVSSDGTRTAIQVARWRALHQVPGEEPVVDVESVAVLAEEAEEAGLEEAGARGSAPRAPANEIRVSAPKKSA